MQALQAAEWRNKEYQALKGTGFVIECLEAALWCFWHTHSYAECVLAAANLGNDADTTAAVAGQLAGAYYGYEGINAGWRAALHRGDEICQLADDLFRMAMS